MISPLFPKGCKHDYLLEPQERGHKEEADLREVVIWKGHTKSERVTILAPFCYLS